MLGHIECSTCRRRCSSTRNTNSTLMVTVGTVKKSIDTIWPMWLRRKVFQVWLGGRGHLRRMRETSAPRSRCPASGVLREAVAHAIADWTRPFARSVGESRRRSRVCRRAGGSPWTGVPRTCENAPAATGRRCRPVRTTAGCASCAKPQTNRPRTADRTRSVLVVSAFAERQRAAAGVQRSRLQRLGDRSTEVERIEITDKRRTGMWLSLFGLILFQVNLLQADGIMASANAKLPTCRHQTRELIIMVATVDVLGVRKHEFRSARTNGLPALEAYDVVGIGDGGGL